MKGLNQVHLIGNLGIDPEMRYTPNGKPYTTFTMATSRKYYTDQDSGNLIEETEWHKVVTWGKLAENCNRSLNKGSAVAVLGRIHYQIFQKPGEETKRNYTVIVARDVIFLDKPTTDKQFDEIPEESLDEIPV